ncbi:putative short chain dehydrogenase/oxidoreductase [Massarina eburnea CBS 473.64]|uniref:Putative short chain dehydrogenase/oxidoreductase n=1 Tax=Massarina eburnea CBS 473.64 TaxID=1395130 RepID=A0A6A6RX84_9PLEO|nr:putative short chain dehydrogenase/oxidoreductase [Massarina eburnea CBS 473.64]
MASFENKVVIVTGCSSGIGLATSTLFLSRGASVFGIDIQPFTSSNLTAEQQSAFTFHQVDLTIAKAADDAVAACVIKLGPKVDVLVNCAGVSDGWSSADTLKDSEWERLLTINLTVPVRLMTAVLERMKEAKSGAIVNVCSKAGVSGAAAGIAYTASKHGLVGATKNVAWRFRQDNIRCNAVLPGGVNTNIASSVNMECFDPVGFNSVFPNIQLHLGKSEDGQPVPIIGVDDVAQGIAFLASDNAKMISGALLPIDSAWSTL